MRRRHPNYVKAITMDMKTGIIFGAVILLIAACGESKVSPDKLTFEQQEQISKDCQKTGKIATDNYCKEVAAVYFPEERRRHEKARLAKELAEKPETKLNMQQ
jgi:hypothetical protein